MMLILYSVALNKENTGICDVVVNGDQMCGMFFGDQVSPCRHLRNKHPGTGEEILFICYECFPE